MSEQSKEKSKEITENEFIASFPTPEVEISVDDGSGYQSIDYKFSSLKEKVLFLIKKYGLDPSDIYIKSFKGKTAVIVRAQGWIKIGHKHQYAGSRTALQEADYEKGRFIFKSIIFMKGIEKPFEATGMCERSERGKETWPNFSLLETAETRAIVRGIRQIMPATDIISEEEADARLKTTFEAAAAEERLVEKKKKELK